MNPRVKSLSEILASAERGGLHRSLGAWQLTLLGIGSIIGTGIFVLTAEAAQKAGPAMLVSFVLAAVVCALCALCYAELGGMVPASGSAYTYCYAVVGELGAWLVGWALILEYAVSASAVAVGWSSYLVGLLERSTHLHFPVQLAKGYFAGGLVDLPAALIGLMVTVLLYIGTRETARINAVLVAVKLIALIIFCVLTIPVLRMDHFVPFAPVGVMGIGGAAASIFFAYVGFDAVSTAAEETRNPQRNVPIAVIGSLVICTALYLLVAAGAVGMAGGQPVMAGSHWVAPGSAEWLAACQQPGNVDALACSDDPLAHVLTRQGWTGMGNLMALAAFVALPSVILTMMFGQTRIFFVMARDGLLPRVLSRVHTRFRTPHVVTIVTGCFVTILDAVFPVGRLADVSNAGTLFAFAAVAIAVMRLRVSNPEHPRSFRAPAVWLMGPLAVLGCILLLVMLPGETKLMFLVWSVTGLVVYFLYGYRHSRMCPQRTGEPQRLSSESSS